MVFCGVYNVSTMRSWKSFTSTRRQNRTEKNVYCEILQPEEAYWKVFYKSGAQNSNLTYTGVDHFAADIDEETHQNLLQISWATWRPPITRHNVMQELKEDKRISTQEIHEAIEDIYSARYEPGSSWLLPRAWRHTPSDVVMRIW